MEIKSKLLKPYTNKQRTDFIVQQNHRNGFTIEETDKALLAWGKTDEEKLNEAKIYKYNEINNGARIYLESGEALFEVAEGKHIEATDGNIAKLSAYALSFMTGVQEVVYWNTKEDETIALNQEQLTQALMGLGEVQATVWNVKFPYYLKLLELATTVEEIKAIIVDYSLPIPEEPIEGEETVTEPTVNEEEPVEEPVTEPTVNEEETVAEPEAEKTVEE